MHSQIAFAVVRALQLLSEERELLAIESIDYLFERVIDYHRTAFEAGQDSDFALLETAAVRGPQGEIDDAIDRPEPFCDAGYLEYRLLGLDPKCAGLRTDTRYEHLMARMNMASVRMRNAIEHAGQNPGAGHHLRFQALDFPIECRVIRCSD